jgi:hypothetical protein
MQMMLIGEKREIANRISTKRAFHPVMIGYFVTYRNDSAKMVKWE